MIWLALCSPNATDIAACALLSLLVQAQALDHTVAARRPWGVLALNCRCGMRFFFLATACRPTPGRLSSHGARWFWGRLKLLPKSGFLLAEPQNRQALMMPPPLVPPSARSREHQLIHLEQITILFYERNGV